MFNTEVALTKSKRYRCGRSVICFFYTLILLQCTYAQVKKIIYQPSDADFPNPERGFYQPLSTGSNPFKPLSAEVLAGIHTYPQTARRASYSVYSTLVLREYELDSFVGKPISPAFLENIQKDFDAGRQGGIKLILRFAYTYKSHSGNCADESRICPPYGDAPKTIVLKHIAQLKPLLRQNADVIALLQMGFIGIWGENYYTDYFGDASMNGQGVVKDNYWRDRNEVLKALLDALPKDRMVQVRTPQIKQRYLGGPGAGVESAGLRRELAFRGTDAARIGFHNDCILSSEDDYGTFYDYGNSNSPRKPANRILRDYFIKESEWVPVGGETCDDTYSPMNDCPPAGRAEEEFRAMHYSYLNTAYNVDVNNDWVEGGCMDRIKKSLGYRFVLREAELPSRLKCGSALRVRFTIENTGYASPFNPRPVQLVLRNKDSERELRVNLKTEIRKWYPGRILVDEIVNIPANAMAGEYEVLLNMPDAYPRLAGNPFYSIRLANEECWEASTGFNSLSHHITLYK